MRVFLPLKKTKKNSKSSSSVRASASSSSLAESVATDDQPTPLQEEQAAVKGAGSPTEFAAAAVAEVAAAEETTEALVKFHQVEQQPSESLLVPPSESCAKAPPLACQKVEGNTEGKEIKPASASIASIAAVPQGAARRNPDTPENALLPPSAPVTSPLRIQSVRPFSARKRRSFSPPVCLDCKPASKKTRDCKPAARETKPKATPTTVAQQFAQSPDNNNTNTMAGGNNRGGRQPHCDDDRSLSSYRVENSAGLSSSSAGPEAGSNFSERHENAPVDVRYNNYRYENDPASARGDIPTTPVLRVLPVAAATVDPSNSSSAVASSKRLSTSLQGDDDVRDATLDLQQQVEAEHRQFVLALKKQGLEIVEQAGDGNCLFRAISLQVYGDASMHLEVRHRCLDFMSRDKEHFSQFITDEPFDQYIERKRKDGVHGNNPEIQAISELFNRPIEVYVPENGASPLNIFHAEYKTSDAPIRLSYHDGNHYNAVIDPLVPTAGLGLGLPGLQPGLADKMQMSKAITESDRLADQSEFERALKESQNDQLQRVIKESSLAVDNMYQNKAMSLSDCDATNFELEQAVLESSLESFRTFEHDQKKASSSEKASSGRRKRQASPPQQETLSSSTAAAAGHATSSVACMPSESRQDSSSSEPIPGAASLASASAAAAVVAPAVASRPSNDESSSYAYKGATAAPMMAEQYPQSVQELVMNGFELKKVVHAYELVGDNFDNLLGFLMSTSSS